MDGAEDRVFGHDRRAMPDASHEADHRGPQQDARYRDRDAQAPISYLTLHAGLYRLSPV